jgi:HEAT repeat protein
MRRFLAAFLLLGLCVAPARADDRAFQNALDRWQAPFRQLAEAEPDQIRQLAPTLLQTTPGLLAAVEAHSEGVRGWERVREAEKANCDALEAAYRKADPRGKRVLVRVAARFVPPFDDSEIPVYLECVTGLTDAFEYRAQELANRWIGDKPDAYLGLLDDPDARVVEVATRALADVRREEVRRHLREWVTSPKAALRVLTADWIDRVEMEDRSQVRARFLVDPSAHVRQRIVDGMEYPEQQAAFRAAKDWPAPLDSAHRWVLLALGSRLRDRTVTPFIAPGLTDRDPAVRVEALNAATWTGTEIPLDSLRPRLRDSSLMVRYLAYGLAESRKVPFAWVAEGLGDADGQIRASAFYAASESASSPDQFRVLLRLALKEPGRVYPLATVAKRVGAPLAPEVVGLLERSDSVGRCLGVEVAVGLPVPKVLAALERLVSDPQVAVRRQLAEVGHQLPAAWARRVLARLLSDADAGVREAAETSLRRLNSPED